MNEQLKFSWGHIIAFLAMIAISYITFVGCTYMTGGDFTSAALVMVGVDVMLFVVFIGAQMLKATTRKFSKRICIERVLIFFSPVIYVVCMLPFYHFGFVQSQDDEIVGCFNDAITASYKLFDDYENYSNERIGNYEHMLNRVTSNYSINPKMFYDCGFTKGEENIQKENMVKALRLQLLSENYDTLKIEATGWIKSASRGASTWNVFLLGNIKEIKSAIHEWNDQLWEYTNHNMTNEVFNGYNTVKKFDDSGCLKAVDDGLWKLENRFTKTGFPPVGTIIFSVLLYFALLFPYYLQDRHTKSVYRLCGMEGGHRKTFDDSEIHIESYEEESPKQQKAKSNDDDDYASFTL